MKFRGPGKKLQPMDGRKLTADIRRLLVDLRQAREHVNESIRSLEMIGPTGVVGRPPGSKTRRHKPKPGVEELMSMGAEC